VLAGDGRLFILEREKYKAGENGVLVYLANLGCAAKQRPKVMRV